MGSLATARLAQQIAAEEDQLVWQSVLTAIADDGSEPAARMACTAAGHRSAEVRRRACEYLAAHPDPRHAPVLLPLLEDANHGVLCEAAWALAAAGREEDRQPLRELLPHNSESLRLEVATALAGAGDPFGKRELVRLAQSRDPAIRRRAAEAMGQLGDRVFASTLIGLLEDRGSVCREALAALPAVVGHDVAQGTDGNHVPTTQRIQLWKQWARQQEEAN